MVKRVVPSVHEISLGIVNAFLLEEADGSLVLIDTGTAQSTGRLLHAIQTLDRQPTDISHILITHCHIDHAGGLAALKQATGAPAVMHPADAALVRVGQAMRPLKPAPGLLRRLMFWLFIRPGLITLEPVKIEHEVQDGEDIPVAGGLRAVHVPGHSAGQLAFFWPHQGGVLFVADAASNTPNLGLSLGYEDLAEGRRSLARLAALEFEVACFGHGRAIVGKAARRFRRVWGNQAR
jgi:glyoxylase-like metal-dependent hydrolase (beta-lactamase superfamily II)